MVKNTFMVTPSLSPCFLFLIFPFSDLSVMKVLYDKPDNQLYLVIFPYSICNVSFHMYNLPTSSAKSNEISHYKRPARISLKQASKISFFQFLEIIFYVQIWSCSLIFALLPRAISPDVISHYISYEYWQQNNLPLSLRSVLAS